MQFIKKAKLITNEITEYSTEALSQQTLISYRGTSITTQVLTFENE